MREAPGPPPKPHLKSQWKCPLWCGRVGHTLTQHVAYEVISKCDEDTLETVICRACYVSRYVYLLPVAYLGVHGHLILWIMGNNRPRMVCKVPMLWYKGRDHKPRLWYLPKLVNLYIGLASVGKIGWLPEKGCRGRVRGLWRGPPWDPAWGSWEFLVSEGPRLCHGTHLGAAREPGRDCTWFCIGDWAILTGKVFCGRRVLLVWKGTASTVSGTWYWTRSNTWFDWFDWVVKEFKRVTWMGFADFAVGFRWKFSPEGCFSGLWDAKRSIKGYRWRLWTVVLRYSVGTVVNPGLIGVLGSVGGGNSQGFIRLVECFSGNP